MIIKTNLKSNDNYDIFFTNEISSDFFCSCINKIATEIIDVDNKSSISTSFIGTSINSLFDKPTNNFKDKDGKLSYFKILDSWKNDKLWFLFKNNMKKEVIAIAINPDVILFKGYKQENYDEWIYSYFMLKS